jgi:hypothetical protein
MRYCALGLDVQPWRLAYSHECRRKGYLAGWENPERRIIQSLETREHWSDPEKRKRIVTSMRAAQQARRVAARIRETI